MGMTQNANETPVKGRPLALITGAAKRIGAHLAQALVGAGYDLVLHYHQSVDQAKQLQSSLEKQGARVLLRQADLMATGAVRALWHGLPPVSLVVHNASIFQKDTLLSMEEESLDAHFAIHVKAPLLLAQGFKRQLPVGEKGHMVLLSDGSFGHSMAPQFFSYAASKMALTEMTDLLAASLAPNVRLNTLALGHTIPDALYDAESFRRMAQKTPLKRHSCPEEVVHALHFLLGNDALTGQVVNLANGMGLKTFRYYAAEEQQ